MLTSRYLQTFSRNTPYQSLSLLLTSSDNKLFNSRSSFRFGVSGGVKFFGTLFCAAAEREQQTGEKTLELLSSVCTHPSFPLPDKQGYEEYQSDFLLDLYSHLKDYETETGLSVLPSLQSVLQSAPAVWIINLSERKTTILLEVLRLQPEKKQVELRGCSEEESEVRTLLQCLPYISQIRSVRQIIFILGYNVYFLRNAKINYI